MKKTFLLRLFACVLAAIPAALAQVKFRVIFDGSSSFYEPVSIAQLSPDVFIWNSRAYYVLSVTPKGGAALLASAPSGYFMAVPFPGPDSRGYSSASGGQHPLGGHKRGSSPAPAKARPPFLASANVQSPATGRRPVLLNLRIFAGREDSEVWRSAISYQPSPRGEREHLWRLGETVAEAEC